MTDELCRKVTNHSKVDVVVFDRCCRGLVMCVMSQYSDYILMDVELIPQSDGVMAVSGCNIIFSSKLVAARHELRFQKLDPDIRVQFLSSLSQIYYSRIGPALIAKRMYPADCSQWIVM